jgi:hypothetical protein
MPHAANRPISRWARFPDEQFQSSPVQSGSVASAALTTHGRGGEYSDTPVLFVVVQVGTFSQIFGLFLYFIGY